MLFYYNNTSSNEKLKLKNFINILHIFKSIIENKISEIIDNRKKKDFVRYLKRGWIKLLKVEIYFLKIN